MVQIKEEIVNQGHGYLSPSLFAVHSIANPYPRHMTAQLTRIGAVFLPSNMTSMRFPDGETRTEVT